MQWLQVLIHGSWDWVQFACVKNCTRVQVCNNTFPNHNKGNKPKLRPSKKKLPPQEWPGQSDLGEWGGGGTTVQNIRVRVCYNHTKRLIVTKKHSFEVSTSQQLRHWRLLIIMGIIKLREFLMKICKSIFIKHVSFWYLINLVAFNDLGVTDLSCCIPANLKV